MGPRDRRGTRRDAVEDSVATTGSGPASDTWAEGRDGADVAYRERLWPSWWVWAVAVSLAGFLGIAYGFAYGAVWGWGLFVPLTAVLVAALVWSAPTVRVDERVLRAGRARLPLPWVGRVAALDAVRSREARGAKGDPAAYLLLRTWTTGTSVLAEVTDPEDPHPYWLVSSRRPEALAAALIAARDRARGTGAPAGAAPEPSPGA